MPNELAKTIINRDVIYVYKQPEISQKRREESGIDAVFEQRIQTYKYFKDMQEREAHRKMGGFLSELFRKNPYAYYTETAISADSSVYRVLMKLENEQKNWYPNKYKNMGVGLRFSMHLLTNFFRDSFDECVQKDNQILQDFFANFSSTASAEIQKMKEEMTDAHLLSILEMESLQETEKVHFLNTKKFSSGQVFIKHPFMPNTYMNIETSEAELFHIKMQCLSRIMQCLGATRVSGHAYVSESKRREMDVNGKISYKIVGGEIGIHSDKNDRYESDYVLEDSFTGEFSESLYSEAISEAKRVGLYDDFDIKNVLEQRNPQKQNTMTGRKLKIEMTRELNESLDVAFSLQAAGFGMNGNYKEILENQKKVMFELDIQF